MTAVVGVIGGVGSGKSTVARMLGAVGARVIDADALAHDTLAGRDTLAAIRERFGEAVMTNGALDRQALAARVFGVENADARRALEAIVHPVVRAEIADRLAAARQECVPLVVLDVPLLLESPLRDECDQIIFVRSNETRRRERVANRGWDPHELARREASQLSLREKEEHADLTLDNDASLEELTAKVGSLYRSLVSS